MLLWEDLIETVKKRDIDTNKQQARWYLSQCVFVNKRSQIIDAGRLLDSRSEWNRWKRNFHVLKWIARQPSPSRWPPLSEIPIDVLGVLEDVVSQTRNHFFAEQQEGHNTSSAGPRLVATAADGRRCNAPDNGVFQDLATFWQWAFLSYLRPDELTNGSYCAQCRRPFPPTKKLRQISKQKLCNRCRQAKWRSENLVAAREKDRKRYEDERQSTKKRQRSR